ncbi:hypothetical protein D3C78_1440050 [compost metagenome]
MENRSRVFVGVGRIRSYQIFLDIFFGNNITNTKNWDSSRKIVAALNNPVRDPSILINERVEVVDGPRPFVPHRVAEHLQKHALEQVVKLLKVLFALGDQSFHFAEQIGNADLVVERRERNF